MRSQIVSGIYQGRLRIFYRGISGLFRAFQECFRDFLGVFRTFQQESDEFRDFKRFQGVSEEFKRASRSFKEVQSNPLSIHGRLNLLKKVIIRPFREISKKFQGGPGGFMGDVRGLRVKGHFKVFQEYFRVASGSLCEFQGVTGTTVELTNSF